ncbi:hypothetical protein [Salinibacterium sp. ZJ454]|uniref:hypothetical protein n=1 Tax=Salinibacterium sp. ZJ454 TaxID=2708339 RepID=UPI001424355A|nr:hypothetical protein [Salinibacterium sp. ZJ454]
MTRTLAAALVVSAALTGCSNLASWGSPDVGDDAAPEVQPYDPTEQPGYTPDESEIPQPDFEVGWSCEYDPTYDDDWHNDVICGNGAESHRPYLREGDDFVTEAEIMESAHEYEAELNATQ